MRLHQNLVRGQDRIGFEPLGEVQRGLHRCGVSHDAVGVVAACKGWRPARSHRTGGEVFDLTGRCRGSVVQDRPRFLVERQRDSRDGVGGGRSLTQRARAAGASMGVSGQVTTLKCDYRVGDGY